MQESGTMIINSILIGREYCRDRQIGCKKEEFDTLMIWQVAKAIS